MKTPNVKDVGYVGIGTLIGVAIFLLIWFLFLKKKKDVSDQRRETNYNDADMMIDSNYPPVRQLGRDLAAAQIDADDFTGAEIGTTVGMGILAGGGIGVLLLTAGAGVLVSAGVAAVVGLAVAAGMYGFHAWTDDKMLKSLEAQRDELQKGTWKGLEQQPLVPDGEGGYKTMMSDQESVEQGTKDHPPVQGQRIAGTEDVETIPPTLESTALVQPGLDATLTSKQED